MKGNGENGGVFVKMVENVISQWLPFGFYVHFKLIAITETKMFRSGVDNWLIAGHAGVNVDLRGNEFSEPRLS